MIFLVSSLGTGRANVRNERLLDTDERTTSKQCVEYMQQSGKNAFMRAIARRFLYKRPGHKVGKLCSCFSTEKWRSIEEKASHTFYAICVYLCVIADALPEFND